MEAYAKSLLERSAKPATWTKFYKDLVALSEASNVDLACLEGAALFLDRTGKLRSAGGGDEDERRGLYVRHGTGVGKRKKGNIPMPPASLSRGYRFFDQKIALPDWVLEALYDAQLLRQFDPIEALAGLSTALGEKPSDKKRTDALEWAFQVWEAAGTSAESAVKDAGLQLPTYGGWAPGNSTAFSGAWTEIGRILEAFLSEASQFSGDCELAKGQLLKPFREWGLQSEGSQKKWTTFLLLLGVSNGMKAIAPPVQRAGQPIYHWHVLFRNGDVDLGLGFEWTELTQKVVFNHPYTDDYRLEGEFWRLPGQLEYNQFPEHLRVSFYELIIRHLADHGDDYLLARIGRYDRGARDWDERTIVTPLGAFLRTNEWLLGDLRGERIFVSPGQCWATKSKRPGVPAFIPRLSDDARVLVEEDEISNVTFGEGIGLLDWGILDSAGSRLVTMANCVERLQAGDIATLPVENSRTGPGTSTRFS